MSERISAAPPQLARPPGQTPERSGRCQIRLVKVGSGVVAGRTTRHPTRTESWTLFRTREQFHACSADDPLRFQDPLLFTQIKAQLDDVFDQ